MMARSKKHSIKLSIDNRAVVHINNKTSFILSRMFCSKCILHSFNALRYFCVLKHFSFHISGSSQSSTLVYSSSTHLSFSKYLNANMSCILMASYVDTCHLFFLIAICPAKFITLLSFPWGQQQSRAEPCLSVRSDR